MCGGLLFPSGGPEQACIQETEIAKAVLSQFQMDPDLLSAASCSTNWYGLLHQSLMAVIPAGDLVLTVKLTACFGFSRFVHLLCTLSMTGVQRT